MPSDATTGNTYTPPKKKKPQPDIEQLRASGSGTVSGDRSITAAETARYPYQADYVSGIFPPGDIHHLNQQVETITLAFQNRFGHNPSPGLIYDLLRAPVSGAEYEQLFKLVPKSAMAARAAGPHSTMDRQMVDHPGPHSLLDRQLGAAGVDALGRPFEAGDQIGPYTDEQKQAQIAYLGMGDPGILLKGFQQVAQSLVYSPVGLAYLVKALGTDTKDIATGNAANANATLNLSKQFAKQVKRDFQHPAENPGYLFLDILGLASFGSGAIAKGGAVGRLPAAGRAAAEGATVRNIVDTFNLKPQTATHVVQGHTARAVLSAAVRRPLPGVYTIGFKEAPEYRLLSENALLRVPQRWYYGRLQTSITEGTRDFWNRGLLTPEKTLSRARNARIRAEGKVLQAPALDLAHVSNSSFVHSAVWTKLPRKIRRSLTPGDEMALFLKSTPHADSTQLWKNFHQKMIDFGIGDPVAHEAKISQIQLAEKSLADMYLGKNPRLKKALALAEEVSHDQQIMKIDSLGLDALAAKERISNIAVILKETERTFDQDQVFRMLDEVFHEPILKDSLRNELEGGYYYPHVLPKHTRALDSIPGTARSSGRTGIPMPNYERRHPELTHMLEGDAMLSGDLMIDVSRTIGASYARTVKTLTIMEDWRRLLIHAKDKPGDFPEWQRNDLIPIREVEGNPEELKDILGRARDKEYLGPEEAEIIGKKEWEDLHHYLFPKLEDARKIEGVKWVDKHLLSDLHRYPGEPSSFFKIVSAVQDPLRVTTLYAKPSYALNMIGNVGMLLMQSVFSPRSMARAFGAPSRNDLSRRVISTIDELVGEGKARSFSSDDYRIGGAGWLAKRGQNFHSFTSGLAHGWSMMVDRWMRRAAFLEEAQKLGYKTTEDFEKLFDLKDEASRKNLYQVTERSNKAMVQFDNLTPFEKETMRHLIFVYPWVSRSAVWGLRTMLEHPLKTWTLSELGQIGEDKAAEFFSNGEVEDFQKWIAPDWFKRTGYIPVARMADGSPIVLNANSVNSFATLNELYTQGQGLGPNGDPFVNALDMAGPGVQLITHIATGKDSYGDPYEEGPLLGALKEQGLGLPQVRAASGGGKTIKPLPGFLNQYGGLISGGLWPKQADMQKLADSYYNQEPTASKQHTKEKAAAEYMQKAKLEVSMIRDAERVTGKILGEPVPNAVHDAVNLASRFTMSYANFASEQGHNPGTVDSKFLQIGVLQNMGRIDQTKADELRASLTKAAKPNGDLDGWSEDFGKRYLHQDEMQDWHNRRNLALSVASNIGTQLDYLKKAGIWKGAISLPKPLSKEDLKGVGTQNQYLSGSFIVGGNVFQKAQAALGVNAPQFEVARKFLDYEDRLAARAPSGVSDTLDAARTREWMDTQDKPIVVDGVKYPSPVEFKWANSILEGTKTDPDYEKKQLADRAAQSWETLSGFEKRLLGVKTSPDISKGWVAYNTIAEAMRGNITPDDVKDSALRNALPDPTGDVSAEDRFRLAKYVDKYFATGFFKDFIRAEEPNYLRYRVLPVFSKGENAKTWASIFQIADQAWRARIKAPNKTDFDNEWKAYVNDSLLPWANQQQGFSEELALYGDTFLTSLIN